MGAMDAGTLPRPRAGTDHRSHHPRASATPSNGHEGHNIGREGHLESKDVEGDHPKGSGSPGGMAGGVEVEGDGGAADQASSDTGPWFVTGAHHGSDAPGEEDQPTARWLARVDEAEAARRRQYWLAVKAQRASMLEAETAGTVDLHLLLHSLPRTYRDRVVQLAGQPFGTELGGGEQQEAGADGGVPHTHGGSGVGRVGAGQAPGVTSVGAGGQGGVPTRGRARHQRRASGDDHTLKAMSVSELLEFLEKEDDKRVERARPISTSTVSSGVEGGGGGGGPSCGPPPTAGTSGSSTHGCGEGAAAEVVDGVGSSSSSGGPAHTLPGNVFTGTAPWPSVHPHHSSASTRSGSVGARSRAGSSVGPRRRSGGHFGVGSRTGRSTSPGTTGPRPTTLHEPSYRAYLTRQQAAAEKKRVRQSPHWATGAKWRGEPTVVQPFSFDRSSLQVRVPPHAPAALPPSLSPSLSMAP
jgi:hypothetical protein